MSKRQKRDPQGIEPGMEVDTTSGDLEQSDLSSPRVVDVVHTRQGKLKRLVLQKGRFFKKKLAVPAERIKDIQPGKSTSEEPGQVLIDVSKEEMAALAASKKKTARSPPRRRDCPCSSTPSFRR